MEVVNVDTLKIRPMEGKDIGRVAYLHQRYIPQSIFKSFGEYFLFSLWQYLLGSRLCFKFVIETDTEVVGFICATLNSQKMLRELILKKGFHLLRLSLLNFKKCSTIILFFRIIPEIIFCLGKRSLKHIESELLFITIEPRYRGQNLAKRLIFTVLEELKKNGIAQTKVTVLKDNFVVNRLLANLGFVLKREFNFCDKELCLYSHVF